MSGTTVSCKVSLIQTTLDALEGHGLRLVRRNRYGVEAADSKWVASNDRVCLCGAIAFVLQPGDHFTVLRAVARKLRIRERDAQALSDGFEWEPGDEPRWPRDRQYMYWHRVGRRFGKRAPREDV